VVLVENAARTDIQERARRVRLKSTQAHKQGFSIYPSAIVQRTIVYHITVKAASR
jgi:hypothetical protein